MAEPKLTQVTTLTRGGKRLERLSLGDGTIERETHVATPNDGKLRNQRAFLTSPTMLGDVMFVAVRAADYVERAGEVVVGKASIPTPPTGHIVNCVVDVHVNYAKIPSGERGVPREVFDG